MTTARVALCGDLAVELDGEPVGAHLPGRQGRLLLALLVLRRPWPIPRDEIIEAIWAQGAQPPASEVLAPLLSKLRRVIGHDRLLGRGEIRLDLGADAWIDVEAAPAAVDRARTALERGAAETALDDAADAAAMLAGGLLPGHDAPFLVAERDDLEAVRLEALDLVATAALRLGGSALAVGERAARDAVTASPFREPSRVLLLETLRARGNVAEGLQAFEEVRILLRTELGSHPGPALTAAHAELLAASGGPAAETHRAPVTRVRSELIERDAELAEIEALLTEATAGRGGVLIAEGPAGVGKTRLLGAARERAGALGASVLTARAGELERELAFGLAVQLLGPPLTDPATRERLVGDPASPGHAAAVVLDPGAAAAALPGNDVSFATLHALTWVVLELAAERPLVLAVDDVQWADRASLRFLAYLARRLDASALAIVATLRPVPDADRALLGELAGDPGARVVRPRPLSSPGVSELVGRRLGADPHPEFTATCRRTTGGNPLLLCELLATLAEEGTRPDASGADAVAAAGPRAVSGTVLTRLVRLGRDAQQVAEAVALLGDRADVAHVAALVGRGEDEIAGGADALAQASILEPDPPLRFVHPLVRDAVYRHLPPGERELRHAAAAGLLRDRGADDAAIATQLRHAPRRGETWVAATLERAASTALARGAPDEAATLLRRALEEPPSPVDRPRLLLTLGIAEGMSDGRGAVTHLRAAHAALRDPRDRSIAAHLLARALIFTGDAAAGIALAEAEAATLPVDLADDRLTLETLALAGRWIGGLFSPESLAGYDAAFGRPIGDGRGARATAGAMAMLRAHRGGSFAACRPVARAVLDGDDLVAGDRVSAALLLTLADDPDALLFWEDALAQAHRAGSRFDLVGLTSWSSLALLRRGEIGDARDALDRIVATAAAWGFGGMTAETMTAIRVEAHLAAGDVASAGRILDRTDTHAWRGEAARFGLCAQAGVLVAAGRSDEAAALAPELERGHADLDNPSATPWRPRVALALAGCGRNEAARALAREGLEQARRWGSPSAVAPALRAAALVEDTDPRPRLREAVTVCRGTAAGLELLRSLVDLADAEEAADEQPAAAALLGEACRLARNGGAEDLVDTLGDRLTGLGSSVPADDGPILRSADRRLARLVAAGHSDTDIALAMLLRPDEVHERRQRLVEAGVVPAQPESSSVAAPAHG